jgi:hypothetical protein
LNCHIVFGTSGAASNALRAMNESSFGNHKAAPRSLWTIDWINLFRVEVVPSGDGAATPSNAGLKRHQQRGENCKPCQAADVHARSNSDFDQWQLDFRFLSHNATQRLSG